MKILHSAFLRNPSIGILNQMSYEQQAAQELSLNWKVKIFCPKTLNYENDILHYSESIEFNSGKLRLLIDWFRLRLEYYRWLRSFEGDVDAFVLRYATYDFFQLIFIYRSKKPIFLVHHTVEIPELVSSGRIFDKVKGNLEKLIGKYAILKSKAIVGVTQEIIDYEKNRIGRPEKLSLLYPNGVLFTSRPVLDKRGLVPEILFVASYFETWQGLDLLLSNIKEYKGNFILHLVGEISSPDKIAAETDSRVILHGRIGSEDIREIATSCWIGLSSFALHRKGMQEACPLKVRDYLMMGLPVFSSHEDVFPKIFKFYRNSTLSISDILLFSLETRGVAREVVSAEARKYIDKVEILRSLSTQMRALVDD